MNIFKKKKEESGFKKLYLKDFEGKTQLVRRFAGKNYYQFIDDLDMPYGRYIYLASFTQAIEMRMNFETLRAYVKKLQDALSGGKGNINIGEAIILLKQLETRTSILFDEQLAYSLASCMYFTDEEQLNGYDMLYNKKKIAEWREAGTLDFFMDQPVRNLLGLKNLSVSDLMAYLDKTRPMLEQLNSAMLTASNNVV